MIAECYDLSVQCDFHPYPVVRRETFQGPARAHCWRQAQARGWRLGRKGQLAKCPACCAAGRSVPTVWPPKEAP